MSRIQAANCMVSCIPFSPSPKKKPKILPMAQGQNFTTILSKKQMYSHGISKGKETNKQGKKQATFSTAGAIRATTWFSVQRVDDEGCKIPCSSDYDAHQHS